MKLFRLNVPKLSSNRRLRTVILIASLIGLVSSAIVIWKSLTGDYTPIDLFLGLFCLLFGLSGIRLLWENFFTEG